MKDKVKALVRELRKNSTKSEKILWECLRGRKLNGYKFLRQYPIEYKNAGKDHIFVLDFYCFEKRLAIELDGEYHDGNEGNDEMRTFFIDKLKIKVIQFSNNNVENNLNFVLKEIENRLPKGPPSL